MFGLFDLLALIKAARMTDKFRLTIEDSNLLKCGGDGQCLAHMGVRQGIIIFIKPSIGCFADFNFNTLLLLMPPKTRNYLPLFKMHSI